MKVTINDREYELKELTKEEAKQYIGKEVIVWDLKTTSKRKLLEVFEPDCLNPFCILESGGKSTYYYPHCAPVPEEWYVIDLGEVVKGNRYNTTTTPCNFGIVDHGSEEYCKQKAKELNEQETEEHSLTYYELSQLLKCFGVEYFYDREVTHNILSYVAIDTNKALSDGYKIRYKCGEWMPATRETVWKWWGEEVPNSDIARYVSFMGWDEDKE